MKKNGVSCLAIMITPGVMKIKVSKNSSFFVFSAYTTKKSVTVWTKYLRASERSYLALSENAIDCWIPSYHWQDISL